MNLAIVLHMLLLPESPFVRTVSLYIIWFSKTISLWNTWSPIPIDYDLILQLGGGVTAKTCTIHLFANIYLPTSNHISFYYTKYLTLGNTHPVIFLASEEGEYNKINKCMELERNQYFKSFLILQGKYMYCWYWCIGAQKSRRGPEQWYTWVCVWGNFRPKWQFHNKYDQRFIFKHEQCLFSVLMISSGNAWLGVLIKLFLQWNYPFQIRATI